MSNLALYWLSKDLDLPGLKGVLLQPDDIESENGKAWLQFASEDWERFLGYREIELKAFGRIHIGLNTLRKERTIWDFQYCEYCLNAPKRILNELLIENGYLDCDSALTPHNMIRTEEMYFEPFRTGRTDLNWETFNYTDSEFIVLKNKDDLEEKRQA